MILIDPPRSLLAARRDPIHKRELAQFARDAIQVTGATGAITVLLTDDARIQQLNRQFRKKNAPTDVLSFPSLEGPRSRSAGELAISLDTAARQAEAFGHSLATEVKVLILHGALHLAGFDHETDNGAMARLEKRLRKELALPSGLIQRCEDPAPVAAKSAKSAAKSRKLKAPATRSRRA